MINSSRLLREMNIQEFSEINLKAIVEQDITTINSQCRDLICQSKYVLGIGNLGRQLSKTGNTIRDKNCHHTIARICY